MPMQRKKLLSPLDRKCLMKFYLHEAKLYREYGDNYTKSLGLEGFYETILLLAEDSKPSIKINANDESNFVILFDEFGSGRYIPLFIMKNGVEEIFEEEVND